MNKLQISLLSFVWFLSSCDRDNSRVTYSNNLSERSLVEVDSSDSIQATTDSIFYNLGDDPNELGGKEGVKLLVQRQLSKNLYTTKIENVWVKKTEDPFIHFTDGYIITSDFYKIHYTLFDKVKNERIFCSMLIEMPIQKREYRVLSNTSDSISKFDIKL